MSVLVVGASGAVGGAVVEGLLERGVEVRASSRTPDRWAWPDGVRVSAADLNDPASFAAVLEGVERVFLYPDLQEPEALCAAFVAAGVRHVVLLSSSSVTLPDADRDFNGSRFIRVERAIEESGVAHTFFDQVGSRATPPDGAGR